MLTEKRSNKAAAGDYTVPKIRLTELSIQRAKPLSSQYTIWDSSLPNFGLRVSPGGTKNFTLMLGARRERISIGRFPIISLAEARNKAKFLMAERTLGHHQPKTIKFEQAYDLFRTQHCALKRTATSRSYQRIINVHFIAPLRHERLEDISYEMLAKITDRLVYAPREQAHAQAVARTFFRCAVRRRYIRHSPLEGVQIAGFPGRDRVLDERELVAVYRAAEEIGYPFGHIVQLLILLGQRRTETAAIRREWIDLDKQTITFPAAVTKNRRLHVLPFGNVTKRVIQNNPSAGSLLFPARGDSGEPFSGWSKCKQILDRRITRLAPWVLHDLRRTFSTGHASLGTPPHITERLLNHVSGTISGVAAIYNRFRYADEMRAATNCWEKHLIVRDQRL